MQPESVQYFQFDSDGNMYVYPAGSGFSGVPRLVHPSEELCFTNESKISNDLESQVSLDVSQGTECHM